MGKQTQMAFIVADSEEPEERPLWRKIFAVLIIISGLGGIILGTFVLLGCISPNAGLKDLYLANIHTNKTIDTQLRVGYFGGCVFIANGTTGGDSKTSSQAIHCIPNMRSKDLDDLAEEFYEDLNIPSGALTDLKSTLNSTLLIVRNLQDNVFQSYYPIAHVLLFIVGGALLFGTVTNQSSKRVYKFALFFAVILSAFALATVFTMTVGAMQAGSALMQGSAESEGALDEGLYVQRSGKMRVLQATHMCFVVVFYVLIGILYAGAPSDD